MVLARRWASFDSPCQLSAAGVDLPILCLIGGFGGAIHAISNVERLLVM